MSLVFYILLVLLPISLAQRPCCTLTRKKLSLPRSCTTSSTLVAKCATCPKGTCRLGYSCLCPSSFLSSTSSQAKCDVSFGTPWPQSIGKRDIDWRSCGTSAPKTASSRTSCCQLSTNKLNALRGLSNRCPSTSLIQSLVAKCQKCPPGTCRVGYSCYCPDYFLSSSLRQSACSSSFTVAWPASVGRNDLDWRSCKAKPPKAPNSGTSCCVLSRKRLTNLRGISPSCPSSSTILSLSSKCQKCPPGTCRVGYRCYCPDYFLSSSSRQYDCSSYFTGAWPFSVGRNDIDWRSCNPKPPKVPKSGTSCCALSKKRLTNLRGISPSCPSSYTILSLSSKCQKCPPGTCRFGFRCYCPDYFLNSISTQNKCAGSFDVAWPVSQRRPDKDFRGCTQKFNVPASGESCCAKTAKELNALRGISNSCPSSWTQLSLVEKCQKCPVGTCRVGYRCYCPEYFLGSPSRQNACADSFGVSWPVSIRKTDLDWRSCRRNPPKGVMSKKSCCKMSKNELTSLRGVSGTCPTWSSITLPGNCRKCGVGRCRLNAACYCPEYFLSSSSRQRDCEDAFGVAWPVSVSKKDTICKG